MQESSSPQIVLMLKVTSWTHSRTQSSLLAITAGCHTTHALVFVYCEMRREVNRMYWYTQHSDALLWMHYYEHALQHVSVTPLFNSTILSDFFSNRDSLQGILFALVEWLMLSESALLINTYGSSFAVEAAHVSTAASHNPSSTATATATATATHAHHINFN